MLTENRKRGRLDISSFLLARYEDDPEEFMDRVVNQDETRGNHHFDPQSMQWKHAATPPHPT